MQITFDTKNDDVAILRRVLDVLYPVPQSDPLPAGSFAPGDLSGDAAPSPIAPEEPTDGVPVPPSVPPVPAVPVTAPEVPVGLTTPAPSDDLDSAGVPWDERIHAATRAKNKDGTWRQRRGLNDPALVARAANPGMNPTSGPPLPTAANVPPPPPAAVTPALTYDGFLAWVTPKMMAGELTFDRVREALTGVGVADMASLRGKPEQIPAVFAALGGE